LRPFARKIELLDTRGSHLRFIPRALAESMVSAESAAIADGSAKVKSIRLIESAASHAKRLGPPSDWSGTAQPFVRREVLEQSNTRVWSFHPRSFD
jgi:hypothetical protein